MLINEKIQNLESNEKLIEFIYGLKTNVTVTSGRKFVHDKDEISFTKLSSLIFDKIKSENWNGARAGVALTVKIEEANEKLALCSYATQTAIYARNPLSSIYNKEAIDKISNFSPQGPFNSDDKGWESGEDLNFNECSPSPSFSSSSEENPFFPRTNSSNSSNPS